MRKSMFYSFIGFLILLLLIINSQVVRGEEEKVIRIVNYLHKMNVEINEWTIFIKDHPKSIKSLIEYKECKAELKAQNPDFTWEEEIDENHHIKLTGIGINNEMESERIMLSVYMVGNKYQMLKTYSFKGESWSEKRFNQKVNNIHKQQQLYFTIKSENNKITIKNLSKIAEKMIENLSASEVESLIEKDFISISAYNDNWGSYIPTNNGKKINLQIGIRRNADSLVDITIGSPIITEEY